MNPKASLNHKRIPAPWRNRPEADQPPPLERGQDAGSVDSRLKGIIVTQMRRGESLSLIG